MTLISPSSGGKPGLSARLGCTGHWWCWRAESETPPSCWRGYHRASAGRRTQKDQGVKVDEWKQFFFTHPSTKNLKDRHPQRPPVHFKSITSSTIYKRLEDLWGLKQRKGTIHGHTITFYSTSYCCRETNIGSLSITKWFKTQDKCNEVIFSVKTTIPM